MLGKEKKPEVRDSGPGFEYYLERYNEQILGTMKNGDTGPKKAIIAREILCKLQGHTQQPVMMTDLLSGSEMEADLSTFVDTIYLLDKGNIITLIDHEAVELTQIGEELLKKLRASGMILE